MSGYQEYECEKGHRWESLDGHGKCPICFPANPPLKDGGPAFPFPSGPEPRVNQFHERWDGMSLRDWFAGQALVGYLASIGEKHLDPGLVAGWSVEAADALIRRLEQ